MMAHGGHIHSTSQNVRPTRWMAKTILTLGILLLLCWTSVLPAAAAIVREPYLQLVTPT